MSRIPRSIRAAKPLPEHLEPASLRCTFLADANSLPAVLHGEHPAALRQTIIALLDSELIAPDGVGRVRP